MQQRPFTACTMVCSQSCLNFHAAVQAEVDTVLQPPRQGAAPAELRQHLQLLVETFKRAHSLAEDLQV